MPVTDLKSQIAVSYTPNKTRGYSNHVYRQTHFLSNYRPSSHASVPTMRGSISRQLQNQKLLMFRSVSLYVFRSTHISRKPQRYRNLPQSTKKQTLSYGYPFQNSTKYPGQCKQDARLAHIRRLRSASDYRSSRTIQQRTIRCRSYPKRLCTRFNNHRSQPIAFSMGLLPQNQRSRQATYPIGFTRKHSNLYSYQRRQTARRQYPRSAHSRTRQFLHYGSRLSGLRQAVSNRAMECFLRDQSKVKFQISTHLLASDRQKLRHKMRPVNQIDWILLVPEIPHSTPQNKVSRSCNREETCFPYQQFFIAGTNYSRAVSLSLADRDLFQMGKTTSANQILFRHHRKCSQDSDMDRNFSLRACCNYQKKAQNQRQSLHNSTGFKPYSV